MEKPKNEEKKGRVFLGWWGGVSRGGATIGDALAIRAAHNALRSAGWRVDVGAEDYAARHVPAAINAQLVIPEDYNAFAWICGPLIPDSESFSALVNSFRHVPRIAAGVSVLAPASFNQRCIFDQILARDGMPQRSFDFALAAASSFNPTSVSVYDSIGICLRGKQREYGVNSSLDEEAERLVSSVVAQLGLPVRKIETRLDKTQLNISSIEASFASHRLIITTRLHGALLALFQGVPFIALDQIRGGGKVSDVLGYLGCPFVWRVGHTSLEELVEAGRELMSGRMQALLQDIKFRAIAAAKSSVQELVQSIQNINQITK